MMLKALNGCPEEDHDVGFQQHLAELLGSAQRALATDHKRVLDLITKHLESYQQVDAESETHCKQLTAVGVGNSCTHSDALDTLPDSQVNLRQPMPLDDAQSLRGCPQRLSCSISNLKKFNASDSDRSISTLPNSNNDVDVPKYRNGEASTPLTNLERMSISEGTTVAFPSEGKYSSTGSHPICRDLSEVRALPPSQFQEMNSSPVSMGTKIGMAKKQFYKSASFHSPRGMTLTQHSKDAQAIPPASSRLGPTPPGDNEFSSDEEQENDKPQINHRNSNDLSRTHVKQLKPNLREITKFELLPEWNQNDEVHQMAKVGHRSFEEKNMDLIKAATSAEFLRKSVVSPHAQPLWKTCGRRLIIHPCSPSRASWDMSSLALVIYDMAVLPLQFFDPPETNFSISMTWTTRLFWTMDMILSFLTGYLLSDASIELRLTAIAMHYLKTWFTLDLLLVLLDWVEVILGGGGTAADYGRVGKLSRTVRILRMIRLLRVVRLREILKLITFRIHSERLVIFTDILKILGTIVAFAHLMACCWYGIGVQTTNEGQESWMTEEKVQMLVLEHRYLLSMHWSLAQFSGGMDEFKAQNFKERLYNVSVFLIAFMTASVCISGLTSSMTRLHILASHQSRQLSVLRRYLIQNGISDRLALRVQRNALHAISEAQRLMAEANVELLNVVSEPLRVELHFEMYSPVLEVHPFFESYIRECPQVLQRVCHKAMSTLLMSTGDIVFNAGEMPDDPKMYIVCNGSAEYLPTSGDVAYLFSEEWVSEAALWTHWMHRGVMKATSDGRLCVLDARQFRQISCQFDHPEFEPRDYASNFVRMLNEQQLNGDTITDLPLGRCGGEKQYEMNVANRMVNWAFSKHGMMDAPRKGSVLMAPRNHTSVRRTSNASVQMPMEHSPSLMSNSSAMLSPRLNKRCRTDPAPRNKIEFNSLNQPKTLDSDIEFNSLNQPKTLGSNSDVQ